MVENELDAGSKVRERDRLVDLIRSDAEVERPARACKPPQVVAERRALAQIVWDDMQHAAKPLDEGICELAFEKGGKIRRPPVGRS